MLCYSTALFVFLSLYHSVPLLLCYSDIQTLSLCYSTTPKLANRHENLMWTWHESLNHVSAAVPDSDIWQVTSLRALPVNSAG